MTRFWCSTAIAAHSFLFRDHTFAHGAHAGDKLHRATANAPWTVEIVNRVRGKPTDRLMRVKMI